MKNFKNLGAVFISYSHDSVEHVKQVLTLSNKLRSEGIDCILDQYISSPPEGWPKWMDKKIRDANKVIMICTKKYYQRVMGEEEEGKGLGIRWEGNLIYQDLYNAGTINTKYIPVIFSEEHHVFIPTPLQGVTYYCVQTKDGYENLYWRLRDKHKVKKPKLGKLRALPKRSIKTNPTMFLTGPIIIDLWDKAKWKGLFFEIHPNRQPLLGLIFENENSAEEIFRGWQKRYGKNDSFEELRLSIIEGEIPGEETGYSIHIGSDPIAIAKRFKSRGFEFNPDLITLVSRIHRMNPPSNSRNLDYFKRAYKKI